jgi:hypothetical protein
MYRLALIGIFASFALLSFSLSAGSGQAQMPEETPTLESEGDELPLDFPSFFPDLTATPVIPTPTATAIPAGPTDGIGTLPTIPQSIQDVPATVVPTAYPLGGEPGAWKRFIASVEPLRFYERDESAQCEESPEEYVSSFLRTPGNIKSKFVCFEMTINYLIPVEYPVTIRLSQVVYRDGTYIGRSFEEPVTFREGRGATGQEIIRGDFGEVYDFTPGLHTFQVLFDGEIVTTGQFETVATVTGTTGCGPGGVLPCPTAAPQPVFRFFFFR